MSSAAGGRSFCQPDLCGKYLQGGASCLTDWSVHVTPCFSRHRPTTLSVVRYRSNSLETGRFLLLVGALPCDDLRRPFSWIWGTTRRQVSRRFGIGLGRVQVSRRGDESVVGRPLIFVWCGSTAWIGCVNLSPSWLGSGTIDEIGIGSKKIGRRWYTSWWLR